MLNDLHVVGTGTIANDVLDGQVIVNLYRFNVFQLLRAAYTHDISMEPDLHKLEPFTLPSDTFNAVAQRVLKRPIDQNKDPRSSVSVPDPPATESLDPVGGYSYGLPLGGESLDSDNPKKRKKASKETCDKPQSPDLGGEGPSEDPQIPESELTRTRTSENSGIQKKRRLKPKYGQERIKLPRWFQVDLEKANLEKKDDREIGKMTKEYLKKVKTFFDEAKLKRRQEQKNGRRTVSYTHLRAHET